MTNAKRIIALGNPSRKSSQKPGKVASKIETRQKTRAEDQNPATVKIFNRTNNLHFVAHVAVKWYGRESVLMN